MNGPEHYRQAERLIALANECTDRSIIEGGWEPTTDPEELATRNYLMDGARQQAAEFRDEAQVHATLALAAATTLGAIPEWFASDADNDAMEIEARGWLDTLTAGTAPAVPTPVERADELADLLGLDPDSDPDAPRNPGDGRGF